MVLHSAVQFLMSNALNVQGDPFIPHWNRNKFSVNCCWLLPALPASEMKVCLHVGLHPPLPPPPRCYDSHTIFTILHYYSFVECFSNKGVDLFFTFYSKVFLNGWAHRELWVQTWHVGSTRGMSCVLGSFLNRLSWEPSHPAVVKTEAPLWTSWLFKLRTPGVCPPLRYCIITLFICIVDSLTHDDMAYGLHNFTYTSFTSGTERQQCSCFWRPSVREWAVLLWDLIWP